MNLYDWTKHYIVFKDLMKKQIVKKTFLETSIIVEEKKEQKIYLVMEVLEEALPSLKKIKKEYKYYITTINNMNNCNSLINKWEEFSKHKNLTILFVDVQENEKWIIHPATHHSISEEKILKEGILSMYQASKQ